MFKLKWMFLKKLSHQIDVCIQSFLNHILPSNLTIRYLIGLGTIAFFVMTAQVLIQNSITKLVNTQKLTRMLELQKHKVAALRKEVLLTQLSSSVTELKIRGSHIQVLFLQIKEDEKDFSKILNKSLIQTAIFPKFLEESEPALLKLDYAIQETLSKSTSQSELEKNRYAIITQAQFLLDKFVRHDQWLNELTISTESKISKHIAWFQKQEFLLLLGILLILIFEGLYVFRPAVENLYKALQARSGFLGRMTHDLKNPMNAVLGMANLLSETKLSEQQQSYVTALQRSGGGLLEVLNSLLDFSSLESGSVKLSNKPFSLLNTLDHCFDLAMFNASSNNTELILDIDSDLPLQLSGDSIRLQQILNNLIGNAVKFTKNGMVVVQANLKSLTHIALIEFSVKDTGIGIAKEKLTTIFDAFIQADSSIQNKFGGTGLGLAIAKDLVKKMGGKLTATSELGLGSEFKFTVPFNNIANSTLADFYSSVDFKKIDLSIYSKSWSSSLALCQLFSKLGAKTKSLDNLILTYENPGSIFLLEFDSKIMSTDWFAHYSKLLSNIIFILNPVQNSNEIEWLFSKKITHTLFKPIRPLHLLNVLKNIQNKAIIKIPRVLIVDDDQDNLIILEAFLKSYVEKIDCVNRGKKALEKISENIYSAVLLDIHMPEMDGYETIRMIREKEHSSQNQTHLPIIAISANEIGQETLRRFEFDGSITKPIFPYRLQELILQTVQKNTFPDSPLENKKYPQKTESRDLALEEFVSTYHDDYLKNRREDLDLIIKYLNESHLNLVKNIAHKIKGTAGMYGFPEIGKIAAQMESAAVNGDLELVQSLAFRFDEALKENGIYG